jgi:DNA polymerase III subunit epsilon
MQILIFDIESTGLDTENDKIVQFSFAVYDEGLALLTQHDLFFNPEREISAEATEVHGITNEMVADKPLFNTEAKGLFDIFMEPDTVICGFNILGFDLKLLSKELKRCGLDMVLTDRNILDVGNLAKIAMPRTLEAVFHRFTGQTIAQRYGSAHNALNDVFATADVLQGMYEKFVVEDYTDFPDQQFAKDLPVFEWNDDWVKEFGKISRYGGEMLDVSGNFKSKDGVPVWNFGKHHGKPVDANDPDQRGLMNWVLGKILQRIPSL